MLTLGGATAEAAVPQELGMKLAILPIVCFAFAILACNNARSASAPASGAAQSAPPADPRSTEIGLSQQQIDAAMDQALKIDPQRCWGYVKQFVAIGSRPLGSAGHKKAEDFIHAHLKGDQVEDDAFTQSTPQGGFPIRNIVAKYPGDSAFMNACMSSPSLAVCPSTDVVLSHSSPCSSGTDARAADLTPGIARI